MVAISHTTAGDYTSPANGLNGFATWPSTPAVDYRITVSTFDTVNRATNVTVKWKPGAGGSQDLVSTNTIYEGVRTVIDPQIGASTATTVDALGRTVSTEVLTTPTAAVTTYAYSYTATVPTDTVNPIAVPSNTTGWSTTTMTDPGNNVTTTVTDLAGRTYRSQEPNAGVSWFAYDANGNVTATKDAAHTPAASTAITTSYDALNRPLTRTDRNGQAAAWAYDGATAGLGMPWKETSNQTGGAFVNTINRYTTRYQIAEQTYTIPGVFGTDLAAGDWRYQTWWTEAGRPYQVSTPNQPVTVGSTSWPTSRDTVRYSYDVYGNVLGAGEPVNATLPAANGLNLDPSKLYVNTDTLTGDGLDDLGRVTARLLERSSSEVGMLREYTYNTQTGAIDRIIGRWESLSSGFQDATDTRDAIGNVTTISDAVTATTECFLYDTRNRLIRAHTAATTSACATDPTTAFTGSRGSDPYDMQWTFDAINRIDTRVDMLPAGAGTLDYQYGDSAHPHAVTGMKDAGGVTLTNYGYSYNPVGAMTSRKSNTAAADTLAYDPSQRLTSYDRASGTDETYQYWATNQRVVRQAGTQRTVYLPSLDITIQGATLTITRQITAGAVVATKTIAGTTTSIYWNCADLENSTTCQTPAGSAPATPTIRHYNPYGTPRNTNTHPNTTRGYLNQPEDPTGLTYLNNRYHDPTIGAFISVDPLVGKTGTPYLYGNGNPSTLPDPTGLDTCLMCLAGEQDAAWYRYNDYQDYAQAMWFWATGETAQYTIGQKAQLGIGKHAEHHGPGECGSLWCKFVDSYVEHLTGTVEGVGDCFSEFGPACPFAAAAAAIQDPVGTGKAIVHANDCGWNKWAECAGAFASDATLVLAGKFLKGFRPSRGAAATNTVGLADDAVTTVGTKISGQMGSRGWSQSLIDDTLSHPSRTVITRDTRWTSAGTRLDDPATAFIRADGSYVDRNDLTGDIVQISNRNDPNWIAPWD